jgi:hypothetical protein
MDTADLTLTRTLFEVALPTLLIQTDKGVYPYQVSDEQPLACPQRFSMHTTAQIAHALALLDGRLPASRLANCPLMGGRRLSTDYQSALNLAIKRIVEEIAAADGNVDPYYSRTFGREDPLSLARLVELLNPSNKLLEQMSGGQSAWERLTLTAKRRAAEALSDPAAPALNLSTTQFEGDVPHAVLHPLPLLRLLQVAQSLKCADSRLTIGAYNWFLGRLRAQISNRYTAQADFDVGDLVFSMEGLLTSSPLKVTGSILQGFLGILRDVQPLNPTLRPLTPFSTSAQGAAHLFSSVEVFMSLMRIANLLKSDDEVTFFQSIIPIVHDYLARLQTTLISGDLTLDRADSGDACPMGIFPDGVQKSYAGWQSEHAYTDDRTVHIWLTSMILVFLRDFEAKLYSYIARDRLMAAKLQISSRSKVASCDQQSLQARAGEADPIQTAPDSPYRVYSRAYDAFVAPRLNAMSGPPAYSCLLYGPSDSGKPDVAAQVASWLNWPLLVITISDYLVKGESGLEARAKELFEALAWQTSMVVLFDNIDRLISTSDVSGDSYSSSDFFDLMTSSMVDKIWRLRALEQIILVISTSHAERLDPGIRRAGNLDQHLLLLPPDLARRKRVIEEALSEWPARVDEHDVDVAAAAGAACTVGELRAAVERSCRLGGTLSENVRAFKPTAPLLPYRRRIERLRMQADSDGSGLPLELLEETFLMAFIVTQDCGAEASSTYEWLKKLWQRFRDDNIVGDPLIKGHLDRVMLS